MNILALVAGILVFGVVVFWHELGHYLAARAFGVGVHEFSVGFGPAVRTWRLFGSRWCLRPIPLGGYVQVAGMDEDADAEEGPVAGRLFSEVGLGPKVVILAAGSIMNLLLAILVWWVTLWAYGDTDTAIVVSEPVTSGLVTGVVPPGSLVASVAVDDRRLEAVAWPTDADFLAKVDDARGRGRQVVMDMVWMGERFPGVLYSPVRGETALNLRIHAVFTGEVADLAGHGPGRIVALGPWRGQDGEPLTVWHVAAAASEDALLLLAGPDGVLSDALVAREELGAWLAGGPRPAAIPEGQEVAWAHGLPGAEGLAAAASTEVEVGFLAATGEAHTLAVGRSSLAEVTGWGLERKALGGGEAFGAGLRETGTSMRLISGFLGQLFAGDKEAREGVMGPIGIFRVSAEAAKLGFDQLLKFVALLSVNLGLVNLLPIPALDGGRLFVLFISEGAKRIGKRLPRRVEGMIHTVGFIVLLLIILAVSWRDISRPL